MRPAALLFALLAGAPPSSGAPARAHDTHVSHTRMVLEGRTVALRVRLFHDDLERGLQRFAGDSTLRVTAAAPAESLFTAYAARTFVLEVDGRRVPLSVTAAGLERDEAAEQVVWYVMEGALPGPARKVTLLDGLLFEVFPDQQNIVQLLRLPADRRQTLYFTARDPRPQTDAP
ncbi:MAG: hypothetical protein IPL76_17060 [Gemmatimonadetes bacterium]|nr:hypothetical protein [Gemmatimonadota bacterium]MBK9691425.1 hypothetical protein [Gemmatimonadota bacterium]